MKEIADQIEEALHNNRLPGAVVAVTDRHRTFWTQAFGYADIDSVRPQREDDIFYIASSSKPLAATTIFMAAEKSGGISTHTKQLLAHSGGIFGNDTKDTAERDLIRNASRTLAEAAAGIAGRPLIYPPGEGTAYSDAGMMLAGHEAAAADPEGREFDTLMRDVLLTPLGMSSTFYRAPAPEGDAASSADAGSSGAAASGEAAAESLASRVTVGFQRTGGTLHRAELQHRLKHDGLIRVGSGLFSTAGDLANFLRFHISNRDRFQAMHRDQTGGRWRKDPMGGENGGYGLGWQLGGNTKGQPATGTFFHAGAFGSLIWAHPQQGLGVVLLTQMPIMQIYAFWRQLLTDMV